MVTRDAVHTEGEGSVMQTFLPVPSFTETAQVLDKQRLNKQALEAWQIMMTNLKLDPGQSSGAEGLVQPPSHADVAWSRDGFARIHSCDGVRVDTARLQVHHSQQGRSHHSDCNRSRTGCVSVCRYAEVVQECTNAQRDYQEPPNSVAQQELPVVFSLGMEGRYRCQAGVLRVCMEGSING